MPRTATPARKTTTTARNSTADARAEHQRDVINRLRRIEGQVRGVIEMIQAERSNDDLALQMSAVRKAMDKAFYRMIACHVQEAIGAKQSDPRVKKEIERVTRLLEKFG